MTLYDLIMVVLFVLGPQPFENATENEYVAFDFIYGSNVYTSTPNGVIVKPFPGDPVNPPPPPVPDPNPVPPPPLPVPVPPPQAPPEGWFWGWGGFLQGLFNFPPLLLNHID